MKSPRKYTCEELDTHLEQIVRLEIGDIRTLEITSEIGGNRAV